MSNFNDLPGRGNNHVIEEKAEAAFSLFISECPNFTLQRADRRDYGVDCQIEVIYDGKPTNIRLHVQVKGSERNLNKDNSLSISVDRTTFNYLVAQRYSLLVAYHVPTRVLLIASVEGVIRNYEHQCNNWSEQNTLTVRFSEELTLESLKSLSKLAYFDAVAAQDHRFAQVKAENEDIPKLLRNADPAIHVPDNKAHAISLLEKLYADGADDTISAAFDRFCAVLGSEHDAISFCYMAEFNLGMSDRNRANDRIKDGIAHFEQKILGGVHQAGGLYYNIGNALSALGDDEAAKLSYQVAAADMAFMADPDAAAQCLKNLGSSFERLGNEDTAASLYHGALDMSPHLSEAHFALGLFYHRRGLYNDALTHYDSVVFTQRELGENTTVIGWRLNALFNLSENREAFRTINQLLADADDRSWIWPWCASQVAAFSRASVETAFGALSFWQRYVRAHPSDSAARVELLLTRFYLRQEGKNIGDYASFRRNFDNHMNYVKTKDSALVWDRLGHWAQDGEDWREAELCFRKAYELDGGDYGYCLGVALIFLKRYEEALPILLDQANNVQPDAKSWFQVGVASENTGQTEEAINAYRKALILDSEYPLAMFNMAGVLWNSGSYDYASIVFRTAAFQFPKHELTAEVYDKFPQLFLESYI